MQAHENLTVNCLYLHFEFTSISRVATAQGKRGIWLLTFPDRENTGNLVNLFFFTQGKWCKHRENFEFFGNFVIKVATR